MSRPRAAPSPPAARGPRPGRRAEHALLLACARPALDPAQAACVRRLAAGPLDWERLLALAGRHRLVPFLHRHLSDAPLPPSARAALRLEARAEAHRGLLLAAELRRLLAALESAGVQALAYKGPALAMRAYGDLSLRSFIDLDLLVRPADVPRAIQCLAAAGYAPALALSPAQERWFRRVDGDYPLVHRETGLLVELHARVSSERFCMPISTEALMRRSTTMPLGGGEVRTLGDEDLLLVLCVHGAKHRWKRLEWVAALAALLRAGRGDARAARVLAAELHARRTLLLGLSLARRLLDAPLPAEVEAEIDADAGLAALAAEAEARLFGGVAEDGDETTANLHFNLRARDGVVDRARYAAR
ncbi:MAG TPA: nucleotidyltransferase family protein, partial [Longimicrobium sp.]|nr:nucleotidyltransferase family protein [Longimicrobium sp.]